MKINESFWPDKRILVTGGCGFLGTNLLQYLVLNKTFHVRAVQHEKDPQWQHPSVKYIKGDLTQRERHNRKKSVFIQQIVMMECWSTGLLD